MTTHDDLVSELYRDDGIIPVTTESVGALIEEVRRLTSAIEAKDAENARLTKLIDSYEQDVLGLMKERGEAQSRISDLERQLAEETERCARVAESNERRFEWPLLALGDERRSPTSLMQSAIAAAIRGGAK